MKMIKTLVLGGVVLVSLGQSVYGSAVNPFTGEVIGEMPRECMGPNCPERCAGIKDPEQQKQCLEKIRHNLLN